MCKYRLCFAIPESDGRFLVPDLLEKEQPDLVKHFDPNLCLHFEYQYPILPEGLLPQFIVRSHALSDGKPEWRWRNGVVLAWEGAEALVQADAVERRIRVCVADPTAEARQRLLAIIRADFDTIHRQYALKPSERVPLAFAPAVTFDYRELGVMERDGITAVPAVVEGRTIMVDVKELLNGVDFGGAHVRYNRTGGGERGVRIFISYVSVDEQLEYELEQHIKLLQWQGQVSVQSSRRMIPGGVREAELDRNLEEADLILILVSVDFLELKSFQNTAASRALERAADRNATVVPILLRDCMWRHSPIGHLAPLPDNRKPVVDWRYRDQAWANVARGIERLISDFKKRG
jgi:internalin A